MEETRGRVYGRSLQACATFHQILIFSKTKVIKNYLFVWKSYNPGVQHFFFLRSLATPLRALWPGQAFWPDVGDKSRGLHEAPREGAWWGSIGSAGGGGQAAGEVFTLGAKWLVALTLWDSFLSLPQFPCLLKWRLDSPMPTPGTPWVGKWVDLDKAFVIASGVDPKPWKLTSTWIYQSLRICLYLHTWRHVLRKI